MNAETIVVILIEIISLGIFIGIVKASLNDIKGRLERIEEKEDKQTEEISQLRERLAVTEYILKK